MWECVCVCVGGGGGWGGGGGGGGVANFIYFGINYACFIPIILPVFAMVPQYQHWFLINVKNIIWRTTATFSKNPCRFKTWMGFLWQISIKLEMSSIHWSYDIPQFSSHVIPHPAEAGSFKSQNLPTGERATRVGLAPVRLDSTLVAMATSSPDHTQWTRHPPQSIHSRTWNPWHRFVSPQPEPLTLVLTRINEHISPWKIWRKNCSRQFQLYFLQWKYLNFD